MIKDHYTGFWVDWYDVLAGGASYDIELYRELLKKSEQPILKLTCGTGRMMVEFIKEGMLVDGVDLAPAMIKQCQKQIGSGRIFEYPFKSAQCWQHRKDHYFVHCIQKGLTFPFI